MVTGLKYVATCEIPRQSYCRDRSLFHYCFVLTICYSVKDLENLAEKNKTKSHLDNVAFHFCIVNNLICFHDMWGQLWFRPRTEQNQIVGAGQSDLGLCLRSSTLSFSARFCCGLDFLMFVRTGTCLSVLNNKQNTWNFALRLNRLLTLCLWTCVRPYPSGSPKEGEEEVRWWRKRSVSGICWSINVMRTILHQLQLDYSGLWLPLVVNSDLAPRAVVDKWNLKAWSQIF